MAATPEESDHRSIKQRIESANQQTQPLNLSHFIGNPREPMPQGLPFNLTDYIELLDLTGRAIREDKRGYIDNSLSPILGRLDITPKDWLVLTTKFETRFKSLVGCTQRIKDAAQHFGFQRSPGLA